MTTDLFDNVDSPEYLDNQEQLEALDNNNGEKSQYMDLILKVLHENGTSKADMDLIQNAIYSYAEAR